jgi:GT2 family glycosyltransferase
LPNAACRASLFDKAGLLPEAYCVGEDLYLNIQALKNGAFIMISEASLVSYHYEKYDLFTFLKSRYRYRTALARVLRDLLPGTLVFRHGSSRSFPLTIWIGNPAWLAGLFLLPGLLLVNPLLLFTGPAWVYLFNCLLVLHRGRSRALGLRRTLYYAWLQSLVSCALFAAQAESLIRYGVVTL